MALGRTDESGREATAVLKLDPMVPEGFVLEEWARGAARLVLLDEASLTVKVAIPFEFEECEREGLPWIVPLETKVLVATETRVFCIDEPRQFVGAGRPRCTPGNGGSSWMRRS